MSNENIQSFLLPKNAPFSRMAEDPVEDGYGGQDRLVSRLPNRAHGAV